MSDLPAPSTENNEQQEPSPIDRRLAEGRSFNDGNWSSYDLKHLFDGIVKYGTQPRAIRYLAKNVLQGHTEDELKVKIFEIRDLANENKDDCREYYKGIWQEKGFLEINAEPVTGPFKDLTWGKAIAMINKNNHKSLTRFRNPVRDTIESDLLLCAEAAETQQNVKITDLKTARASVDARQDINWENIYKFVEACISLQSRLPPLNELEAAIVIQVMDAIEDEASQISKEDRSTLCGMFSDIQNLDLRAFEPDTPCNTDSAVQAHLDPLRTRLFGVPLVAADHTTHKMTVDNGQNGLLNEQGDPQ
ncbi:unnamed protein product [Caenorhabditis bovis]|uniref:Uncharacterized protein n=1 Tax=Caenorhabditis bovis TaxID=2654633 RepID=A0A8S1F1B9_9PELO|nr:unnamed protein product [Caenorhabditis bovis]